MSRSFRLRSFQGILSTVLIYCLAIAPAFAQVNRIDDGILSQQLKMSVSQWQNPDSKPQGIVLAIHGLGLHGTVYDTWAKHLAEHDFLVVAPDLRGYGRWYASGKSTNVQYKESESDLRKLVIELREQHPGIPFFVAGESLGGALAVRFAARNAELVDGLILSAPALRHCHCVPIKTFADSLFVLTNPAHRIDVSPYYKNYFSEDERIGAETLADPLVRKRLSVSELLSTRNVIASSRRCVKQIPRDMPVLLLHDTKDRMVKLSGIDFLKRGLSADQTQVYTTGTHGHILLETSHVNQETLTTVSTWISQHCIIRSLNHASVAVSVKQPAGS